MVWIFPVLWGLKSSESSQTTGGTPRAVPVAAGSAQKVLRKMLSPALRAELCP